MIETFSIELEKINKQSSNTGNSARVYHPFYLSTKTNKVFGGKVMPKEEAALVDQKIQEILRKDAISITENIENNLIQVHYFWRGKRTGKPPGCDLRL